MTRSKSYLSTYSHLQVCLCRYHLHLHFVCLSHRFSLQAQAQFPAVLDFAPVHLLLDLVLPVTLYLPYPHSLPLQQLLDQYKIRKKKHNIFKSLSFASCLASTQGN